MPERPDLEYIVPILAAELRGRVIRGVRVKKPVVLRVAVEGKLETLIAGKKIGAVTRRAHFIRFALGGPARPRQAGGEAERSSVDDLELVVSPMLAGRFTLAAAEEKSPADLAVAFALDDGRELRYRDDVQMGKVYLIRRGDEDKVPGLGQIGLDILDPKVFTRDAFRALAARRRDQVKVFLMDKTALDAMGNAYADEVLWEARLHPKTFVKSLAPAEIDRLHGAISKVIGQATRTILTRKPALDEKLRDFLKVRGKHGEPCPRCGAKLRSAGVHGHDADFCPECQPATRKSGIVDWKQS